jgi:hypothetical protein
MAQSRMIYWWVRINIQHPTAMTEAGTLRTCRLCEEGLEAGFALVMRQRLKTKAANSA